MTSRYSNIALSAWSIVLCLSCQQTTQMMSQSSACAPEEDCSASGPPFLEPDGTGGDNAFCIVSPLGVYPLPTPTQLFHVGGFDFAATTIYAPADGFLRPYADSDSFSSRDCYKAGACYAGTNCPCVKDSKGNYQLMCKPGINQFYTEGGQPDYDIGLPCQNNKCGSDNCANPDFPCPNRASFEFKTNGLVYLLRVLHIEKLLITPGKEGVYVKAGDPIATVGNTGFNCTGRTDGTGKHGHVEVRDIANAYAAVEGWRSWVSQQCSFPQNCTNSKLDGVESDVDCGGLYCGKCAAGKRCKISTDCSSASCVNRICAAPTNSCTDGLKNGNETSLDCGGSCPPCADGLTCINNGDCLNGYCSSNVCISAPQILVDNRADPFDLTLDANNIYWVEKRLSGGTLCKVSKGGGNTITLSSNLAEPTAVIVDANYAYVLERNNGSNGMIHRIPLAGGSTELVVSGLTNAQNTLVQSGNNLYWGDFVSGTGGVIKTAPKGASVSASIVAQMNGLANLQTALDTDGTYLYIRNDSNQMLRFPIGGGSPSMLGATGTSSFLADMRVMLGTVYYAGDNVIASLPAGGGTISTLVTTTSPRAIAVDNAYVYFIDASTSAGSVRRTAISGGQLKTYYSQANSNGIEVDATHVYWITNFMLNQGKIMRAPKSL